LIDEVEMKFDPIVSLGLKHPDPAYLAPVPMWPSLTGIRAALLDAFMRLQVIAE